MRRLAAALVLLALAASAAADDCDLEPDDRVEEGGSNELVVELLPGEDPVAVAIDHGLTIEDLSQDWIPQILMARMIAQPGLGEPELDALESGLESDRRVKRAEIHEHVEDPEGVQQTLGEILPGLPRAQYTGQPAATLTRIPQATASLSGAGLTIAVIDTGVSPASPELAAVLAGPGLSMIPDAATADVPPNGIDDDLDGNTDEAWGHGTHVAGLVHLAAPGALILPIRVLDDDGKGTSFRLARGIVAAVVAGADAINLSLGLPHDAQAVETAIEYAAAHDVVIVTAAGNRGLPCVDFPADRAEAIGVAAVDQAFTKPAWASYGTDVALSAPATGTISPRDASDYSGWDGSSFASPLVTGGTALLLERFPGLMPDEVKATIRLCVQPDAIDDATVEGALMGTGVLDLGKLETVEIAGTIRFDHDDAAGSDDLSWSPLPGRGVVDIARGLISALWADDDTVYLGDLACIGDDVPTGTRISDPASPPPGDAFFYVIRDDDPGSAEPGPWGRGSGNREHLASSAGCGG